MDQPEARMAALQSLIIWSHRIGRVVAREAGSTTPAAQWRALSTLEEQGAMRLGALAAECRVTQPGMTRLVAQMAESGLVERERDPGDERVVRVVITEAGRRARADWLATIREVLAPRFADLDPAEWDAIGRVAELIAARAPA